MKLVAAPLLIRVGRLTNRRKFSQRPIVIADRFRTPPTIHDWITECAAVRCPNLAVGVTASARSQRRLCRTEVRTAMLVVTINAANARGFVRLDHGRDKSRRVVTRGAALLHVVCERMTVRA